jgi:hypothetical protein
MWSWLLQISTDLKSAKMAKEKRKQLINFIFWSADCFLLTAECFSCSLGVLYKGLGVSKLQFFLQINEKISALFFLQFLVIKTLDLYPATDSIKMLDSEPYPNLDSMNPDPKQSL